MSVTQAMEIIRKGSVVFFLMMYACEVCQPHSRNQGQHQECLRLQGNKGVNTQKGACIWIWRMVVISRETAISVLLYA
jgi:hypothetical protein